MWGKGHPSASANTGWLETECLKTGMFRKYFFSIGHHMGDVKSDHGGEEIQGSFCFCSRNDASNHHRDDLRAGNQR